MFDKQKIQKYTMTSGSRYGGAFYGDACNIIAAVKYPVHHHVYAHVVVVVSKCYVHNTLDTIRAHQVNSGNSAYFVEYIAEGLRVVVHNRVGGRTA